jgi:flagella basal body P-ring formation protein FlgA
MPMTRTLTALLLLCLVRDALADDAAQPVASIRAAAESAIAGGPGAQVQASIDERLRMPRCGVPLTAMANNAATVEVTCPDPAGWKLYVPVRVTRTGSVLVLTRPVAAGMPIPADALALETRDLTRVAGGALDRPELAAGRIARRALGAGTALGANDLSLPAAVRRGQLVTLVARSGGLEVRSSGKAVSDGAPGERVMVENPLSRRQVQGVVQDSGEVWVQ